MAETHVISALVAKRAALAGQMLDLDKQKAALRVQLGHIDHTLAIFGYGDPPRDIKPKLPKVYRFKRRELPRLMGDAKRELGEVTNKAVALYVMVAKGWDADDADLVRKVTDSVKSAKNWQSRSAHR